MVAPTAVGAGFGLERFVGPLHPQAPLPQQILQHWVGQQAHFTIAHLQGHVTIAQVVSRLQQGLWAVRLNPQQRFGRRVHPHPRQAIVSGQPLPRQEGLSPWQLQQEWLATTGLAQAAQPRAFLRREVKHQRLPRRPSGGVEPETLAQLQGWRGGVIHRGRLVRLD